MEVLGKKCLLWAVVAVFVATFGAPAALTNSASVQVSITTNPCGNWSNQPHWPFGRRQSVSHAGAWDDDFSLHGPSGVAARAATGGEAQPLLAAQIKPR